MNQMSNFPQTNVVDLLVNYSRTSVIRTHKRHDKSFELSKLRIMESNITKNFLEGSKKSFEIKRVRIQGVRVREVLLY